MAVVVQKFGGTSVGDVDRIRNVANKVKKEYDKGNQVVVVVSAMAGVTNQLVELCGDVNPSYDMKEYDTVVSTGEQVTIGLLAIALQSIGVPARSFTGWQLHMITDEEAGKARIDHIDVDDIKKCLDKGIVPVVAGFQGVDENNRITTLGRGGSDTSAVAIAAALKADRCDIYTDVDGVYTTDPRFVKSARRLDKLTYEEMLEMASLGAKVLQTRSVELAMKYQVNLRVVSSFEEEPIGTTICDEEDIVEKELISGITYSRDEAKITLSGVRDEPGVSAAVFDALASANICVDMIVQTDSADGSRTDITFTLAQGDVNKAISVLDSNHDKIGYHGIKSDTNCVKVSVIGVGMRTHAGIANKMFHALSEKGINVQTISTSEIKISVLIADEYTELAVRALHTAFNLENKHII
ncbi:MAG: aspartate kinase [Alphaproteobacteria bacterium]|nr:aspartate kinase [Alphaproteobacteria bacterium]